MAGSLGELFGGESAASQFVLWGVGYGLASSLLAPVLDAVRQQAYAKLPDAPLSPADAADQVVRNIRSAEDGQAEAALSGVNAARFASLVEGAGEPPGLEFLMQAFRRGILPWGPGEPGTPSVLTGIATSRVYNYWADTIQAMLAVPLSPADAVNAVLRQQIPMEQGQNEAYASGINPERFQVLLDTAGRPPSPTELVELYRRGLIPFKGTGPDALSFEQGIYEGDAKDKWEPLYERLAEYVVPARVVTTLYRTGSITAEQASAYFVENGLTTEQAAQYLHSVNGEKLAGTRQLAQGVVTKLYTAGAIDNPTAVGFLGALGYTPAQSAFILALFDLDQEVAALTRATNRIGQLYTKHKITRAGAVSALTELGVVGDHQAKMMAAWDEQAIAEVQLPTISEIGKAIKYLAITPEEGLAEAVKLGYSPFDAYVALSAAAEAPVGTKPANTPTPPGVI